MGSGESCWGGAREETYWHPIPSFYQQMDENVGRCLSHPALSLALWAELPLSGALGQEVGESLPFADLAPGQDNLPQEVGG